MNHALSLKMAAAATIPAEVIQKLNLLAAARAAAHIVRKPRVAVRDFQRGFRVADRFRSSRGLSFRQRRDLAMDHNRISNEGVASAAGIRASDATARARAAGRRIGQSLRSRAGRIGEDVRHQLQAGGNLGRNVRLAHAARVAAGNLRGAPAYSAGIAAGAAKRVWVNNAQVAGGGFWRRLRG